MLSHMLRASNKKEVELTFISGGSLSSTSSSTKSSSAFSIGTASSDRWVIVLFQHPTSSTARTLTSATINGVSATIGYNIASSGSVFGAASFYALVPSGSGAVTITANLSGSTTAAISHFFVYTLKGRTTLAYSNFNASTSATATSRSTTLNAPTNGFNLNNWLSSDLPTSGAWSGTPTTPNEQSRVDIRASSSAYKNFTEASLSVGATFSQSNSIPCRLISSSYTYS